MTKDELDILLLKFRTGQLTEEELDLFYGWYHSINDDDTIPFSEVDLMQDIEQIKSGLQAGHLRSAAKLWKPLSIVASFVLAVGSLIFLYHHYNFPSVESKLLQYSDIGPGGNKAVLILSNGKKVNLASIQNGKDVSESGVRITKTKEGQLMYTISDRKSGRGYYNTIVTPYGGQYNVILPDGSKVWLNAASSIKFPTTFGVTRNVELRGEAYFEVKHDKVHPFHVKSKNQDVAVLGTHFNINAYNDEGQTTTTLLQGKVQLNGQTILTPGYQSLNNGGIIRVSKVDTQDAIDWKNGDFIFKKGDDFKANLRKIARWYNVEFTYEPGFKTDIVLVGGFSRKFNISVVLERIESIGNVHFVRKGRRIMVKN